MGSQGARKQQVRSVPLSFRRDRSATVCHCYGSCADKRRPCRDEIIGRYSEPRSRFIEIRDGSTLALREPEEHELRSRREEPVQGEEGDRLIADDLGEITAKEGDTATENR